MPEKEFWEARWEAGEIGFHEGRPNALLTAHVGVLGQKGRVLVPLCGRAEDLAWLREAGWNVVGVEYVESAARDFFRLRGLEATEVEVGDMPAWTAGGITIVAGDMFAVHADDVGRFDAIYDRAALVAIDPDRRAEYVDTLRGLCMPGAPVLLISMEHDRPGGPPWSVDGEAIRALWGATHDIEELGVTELLELMPTPPPGVTFLRARAWALRPRPE
jgi:thiopurine S-methyltransferase